MTVLSPARLAHHINPCAAPIDLLNSILETSRPQDVIRLTIDEAEMIGGLGESELGELCQTIAAVGAVRALRDEGLFSRRVVVSGAGRGGSDWRPRGFSDPIEFS
jgi:hypothetical protein